MDNPFLYFNEIHCINLSKRIDRWLKVKKEFTKVGIHDIVHRFSAIETSDGRIGCIKSHLEIIKKAKKAKLDNVLVLEDDVTFISDDLSFLSQAIKQLPQDWELFYLGANLHTELTNYSENLLHIKNGFSTHAIAYSKNVYDKFIDKYQPLKQITNQEDILDVWLAFQLQNNSDKCFLLKPLLATQINDYSDIAKSNVDYSFIQERYEKFVKK